MGARILYAVVALLLLCAAWSFASPAASHDDFQFAKLRYHGGRWNPRPRALSRLAWEVRKRTSIATSLEPAAVDIAEELIFEYPLLMWLGDRAFPPLPETAVKALRHHLSIGGTLFVDLSDGQPGGGFDRAIRRELARILPGRRLAEISSDHVLYKSFYLVDRHGGRVQARPYLEGLFVNDRLAVILSANDMVGAVARDDFGGWTYDVGPGGDAVREATIRLAVNVVMYTLCLDYKDDLVHIPFILKRRR